MNSPKYLDRGAERQGITFENFLSREFDILLQLSPERLQEYFNVLAQSVIDSEYKFYTRRLHAYFEGLSKQDGRYIKKQVEGFKNELKNKPTNTAKLLTLFNGYLRYLKNDFSE